MQDTNASGAVSTADINLSIAGRSVANTPVITGLGGVATLANAANGLAGGNTITLAHSGDALAVGTTININYLGLADLVTVKDAAAREIPLRMRETGPDTGIYSTTVIVIDGNVDADGADNANLDPTLTEDAVRPHLAGFDGGAITVSYNDQNGRAPSPARVSVESGAPTFPVSSPADNATVNVLTTELTVEVTDTIAGVNPSAEVGASVAVFASVNNIPQAVSTSDISVAETFSGSGVYSIKYSITNLTPIADLATTAGRATITWRIEARDNAGNLGSTDADAATAGAQPFTLFVDNRRPELNSVVAGTRFDSTITDDPATAADERLVSSREWIRVVFDRAMDSTSFQTSDFLVDGVEPTGIDPAADLPDSVFLQVPTLAPTATPRVEIVGDVADLGSNFVDTNDVTASVVEAAADGISPGLTVNIANSFTTGTLAMTVTSDEPIVGALPQRAINRCVNAPTLVCTGDNPSTTSSRIVTPQVEWSFDLTGFNAGQYNITVTARDAAGNLGTKTETVEIDPALAAPVGTTPAAASQSPDQEPFVVEIDWTSEAEYDGDTHAGVTLTSAVLDAGTATERNVLGLSGTRDNRTFSIAISKIGIGSHTLTFNGTDDLGNTLATAASVTFTVVEPPPFLVTLSPGMNLKSVPRDPKDKTIGAVFGGVDEVNLVFTRPLSGEANVPWLIAVRDPVTGLFVGDLKTIDARHAYWVKATATVVVSIATPPLQADQVPPTIAVIAGEWNLVPVISLAPIAIAGTPLASTADIQEGTELDVDNYFGLATWSKAFTFGHGQRIGISPNQAAPDNNVTTISDAAQIGRGYWVLYTTNTNLTPGIKR